MPNRPGSPESEYRRCWPTAAAHPFQRSAPRRPSRILPTRVHQERNMAPSARIPVSRASTKRPEPVGPFVDKTAGNLALRRPWAVWKRSARLLVYRSLLPSGTFAAGLMAGPAADQTGLAPTPRSRLRCRSLRQQPPRPAAFEGFPQPPVVPPLPYQ